MPDTPSHFSVSSPSLSKGLPFFATLASVKPGVNYGPIINVAGLPFSWTPSGYEPSSGAFTFPTLSSLLSTAPQPGTRATASDAPGSMLYEVGGKWGGSLGSVTKATLDALTAGELAMLADGAMRDCCGVVIAWNGVTWVPPRMPVSRNGRIVHIMGDSTTTAENGLQWAELLCLLSRGRFIRGINAATSGAKIQDVATSQLANKLLAIPCDEIWIQIGRNNSFETVPVCVARLALLFNSVRNVYPLATIRLFSILTSSDSTNGTRFTYAWNTALQSFARENGCEYHDGWSGVAAPDGSLSTTYSVDTVHVGLAGNLLAAQARLADILGPSPTSLSPSIIGEMLSWDISLMNLDTDANGVSDTWNNYAIPNGGTSQASLVACSAPYVGKWQRRTLAAHIGTVHDLRTGILIDPKKDYELSLAMDVNYPANASVRGWVKFSSSATSVVEIGSLTLFNWSGAGKATLDIDGFIRFLIPKEVIPANTLSVAVELHSVSIGAVTSESNWGMLALRELTNWR